jgi:hypothetical protein
LLPCISHADPTETVDLRKSILPGYDKALLVMDTQLQTLLPLIIVLLQDQEGIQIVLQYECSYIGLLYQNRPSILVTLHVLVCDFGL